MLAALLLMQPRIPLDSFAARAHCWLTSIFVSTMTPRSFSVRTLLTLSGKTLQITGCLLISGISSTGNFCHVSGRLFTQKIIYKNFRTHKEWTFIYKTYFYAPAQVSAHRHTHTHTHTHRVLHSCTPLLC